MSSVLPELKPFVLVKFLKDSTHDFVPKNWIEEEDGILFVRFPKVKSSAIKRLQFEEDSHPKGVWPRWEISVKKSYDTAEKAERKAERYQVSSDLESSSRESGPIGTHQSRPFGNQLPLPAAVAPDQPLFPFQAGLTGTTGCEVLPNLPATPSTSTLTFDSVGTGEGQTYFVSTCANGATLDLLLTEQRAFQEKVLHNQEILISEQRETKALLLNVLAKPTTSSNSGDKLFPLLPLRSEVDLHQLEDQLQLTDNFDKLVRLFDRFGRVSVTRTVGDLLGYLFELSFSKTVRYTAISGKIAFGQTRLAEVVRVVARNNHSEAKDKDINLAIQVWFRGSTDRGGGRVKRNGNPKAYNQAESPAISGAGLEENQSSHEPVHRLAIVSATSSDVTD